jgi:hypothetical protein
MCDVCQSEKCSLPAEPLCNECLQELILDTVRKAVESHLADITRYHDAKRRAG